MMNLLHSVCFSLLQYKSFIESMVAGATDSYSFRNAQVEMYLHSVIFKFLQSRAAARLVFLFDVKSLSLIDAHLLMLHCYVVSRDFH